MSSLRAGATATLISGSFLLPGSQVGIEALAGTHLANERTTPTADAIYGSAAVSACIKQSLGGVSVHTNFARADARPYIEAKGNEKEDRKVLIFHGVGSAISKKCMRIVEAETIVVFQQYTSGDNSQGNVPTRNSGNAIFGSATGLDPRKGFDYSQAKVLRRAVNSDRYSVAQTVYLDFYTGESVIRNSGWQVSPR